MNIPIGAKILTLFIFAELRGVMVRILFRCDLRQILVLLCEDDIAGAVNLS